MNKLEDFIRISNVIIKFIYFKIYVWIFTNWMEACMANWNTCSLDFIAVMSHFMQASKYGLIVCKDKLFENTLADKNWDPSPIFSIL